MQIQYKVFRIEALTGMYFVYEIDQDGFARRILAFDPEVGLRKSLGAIRIWHSNLCLEDPTPQELDEIEIHERSKFLGATA